MQLASDKVHVCLFTNLNKSSRDSLLFLQRQGFHKFVDAIFHSNINIHIMGRNITFHQCICVSATDTVTNATDIFSLATTNSGLVATLVTGFLYDLDLY